MGFKKYVDVEALHKEDVEGLLVGDVYVFPKLDGTNASIWLGEDGQLCAGSRNRDLSTSEKDNFGFQQYVRENAPRFMPFFNEFPKGRLFGEWLVPHTLRTYRDDAWNKFHIFDVQDNADGEFLCYDAYSEILKELGIDFVPLMMCIKDPTVEQLTAFLEKNTYLIQDGKGYGEGIVVKRYGFRNKHGHQAWGKIVRNEFKEQNGKAFGAPSLKGEQQIELDIAKEYVTSGRVEKVLAKMAVDGAWEQKKIPQLLNRVYHEIVTEEMWQILKDKRNPTINFRKLNVAITSVIKEVKPELF